MFLWGVKSETPSVNKFEENLKHETWICLFLSKGIEASHQLAKTDKERVEHYALKIIKAAEKRKVDAAVIAGIMSRESRVGHTLDDDGYGDNGKAFGLMQVVTYCCSYSIFLKRVTIFNNSVLFVCLFLNLQIDRTKAGGNHKPKPGKDSDEHIDQATGILVYFIQTISENFPDWSEEQKLKGSQTKQHCSSFPS